MAGMPDHFKKEHQRQHAGPALTAIAFIIFLTAVLFTGADLQFQHLTIDSQVPWEHQPTPNSPNSASNNQTHQPTIVEISTTREGAHDRIVPSTICVSAVEVPIQDSSVPTPRDSHFPDLDDGGPRTPLRPLILEWKLQNHYDKTFVEQLLSDIRHGCDIGYSGPQFAHTASNLQSAFSQPSVLDDALVTECSLNRVLGPFDSATSDTQV